MMRCHGLPEQRRRTTGSRDPGRVPRGTLRPNAEVPRATRAAPAVQGQSGPWSGTPGTLPPDNRGATGYPSSAGGLGGNQGQSGPWSGTPGDPPVPIAEGATGYPSSAGGPGAVGTLVGYPGDPPFQLPRCHGLPAARAAVSGAPGQQSGSSSGPVGTLDGYPGGPSRPDSRGATAYPSSAGGPGVPGTSPGAPSACFACVPSSARC